jgi:hypothetical protein
MRDTNPHVCLIIVLVPSGSSCNWFSCDWNMQSKHTNWMGHHQHTISAGGSLNGTYIHAWKSRASAKTQHLCVIRLGVINIILRAGESWFYHHQIKIIHWIFTLSTKKHAHYRNDYGFLAESSPFIRFLFEEHDWHEAASDNSNSGAVKYSNFYPDWIVHTETPRADVWEFF